MSKPILGDSLNLVDRLVGFFDPAAGLRRMGQRHAYQAIQSRAHEAAQPSRHRKFYTDNIGPNSIVQQSSLPIRVNVRHIVRNNDIARGILRTMVNNTIGASGIGIEPQPRRLDGTIHEAYAEQLRHVLREWSKRPEVTRTMNFSKVQRSLARGWFRDGEIFSQDVIGTVPGLAHRTDLPYSLEVIEAEICPLQYNIVPTIMQGIERNAWGEAKAYWFYKGNPFDTVAPVLLSSSDLKRVDASRIRHLAFRDHIGQARGISEFASIIGRLEDIKDYEESERIAAKIAASLTAYVKKVAGPDGYDPTGVEVDPATQQPIGRRLQMSPGMIIDGLSVGEEIGLIDSNRPNPNVVTFRQGQLRAAASGIGASYSSIAKSYDGTFSSQRQELVEQWVNYAVLADEFVGDWLQPTWETIVNIAHISGVARIPKDVKPGTADDALFTAQAMPWIDPLKEASAWVMLNRAGYASEPEIIRKRGGNPRDVLEQTRQWRQETAAAGMVFTSNAANGAPVTPPESAATATAQPAGPDNQASAATDGGAP